MSRIIWDRTGNPSNYVSDTLGIERWQLRDALHKIKDASDLGPRDHVIIYEDGRVTDTNGGEIGNIYDQL